MFRNWFYLIILFFVCLPAIAQTKIVYGSNKGKYISVKNTKIYYEEYGNGIPLLLLHGGLGSINDFQKVIPELSKHFRVIAFDRPEHGRSYYSDSLSYQLMADYSSAFIDTLKLDSIYVIGWSDGANTGLLLASDRPDKVKKLIVSGANYSFDGLGSEAKNFVPIFTPEFAAANMKEMLEDYKTKSPQKNEWRKFITDIQKLWSTGTIISEEKLKQIKIPVLLVLGDKDGVTLEHGIQMYHLIKGSQFCILPSTTHFVFAEKPGLIYEIAMMFLKSE